MGNFVVAGVTQRETIVKVNRIPVDYAEVTDKRGSIYSSIGGDALNEALALRWLGNDVRFMSIIGRDQDPDVINSAHHKIRLNTDYVIPQMEETPDCVILYDEDRRQQIFEDPKDLRENVYDMNLFTPMGAWADMVVLANANFCRPFAEAAAEYGKRVAVNIRYFNREKEKYNEDFLKVASILYFSDDSLEEDPYEFVKGMSARYGTEIIILGQGSKGVILYDRDQDLIAHYNIVKTNEIVNTVGAGNAMFSCFLHYYQETGDSVNAIKNGLLFSSYKIGYMGTSMGFMTTEQLEQWKGIIWREDRPN